MKDMKEAEKERVKQKYRQREKEKERQRGRVGVGVGVIKKNSLGSCKNSRDTKQPKKCSKVNDE